MLLEHCKTWNRLFLVNTDHKWQKPPESSFFVHKLSSQLSEFQMFFYTLAQMIAPKAPMDQRLRLSPEFVDSRRRVLALEIS